MENLLAAIEAVLAAPETLQRVLIAADPQALTVGEMIKAMRAGLGRKPDLFPLPPTLLALLLRSAGRTEMYERLSGSLVADSSALLAWPRLGAADIYPDWSLRVMEGSVA